MHSALKKTILILLPITAFLLSFTMGRYGITLSELLDTIYQHVFIGNRGTNLDTVVFNIRLPRILAAMLVGAALSTAGSAYQGMFKNPLVSPDILGASAGAGFGACLAIFLAQSGFVIQISAFFFGLIAVIFTYFINVKFNFEPTLGLVLGGMLISSLFSSGTGALKYFADANDTLPAMTFWLMGSLSSVSRHDLLMVSIPMLVGFIALFAVRWQLNGLAFGEEEARTLGIDTKRIRAIVIISSTLITSASVSLAGMVSWVGLVIPHLARSIVGPNYKKLLPVTFVLGATYLLLVDDLARCLGTVEAPLGILTALIGVPFFILIFKRNIRGWK